MEQWSRPDGRRPRTGTRAWLDPDPLAGQPPLLTAQRWGWMASTESHGGPGAAAPRRVPLVCHPASEALGPDRLQPAAPNSQRQQSGATRGRQQPWCSLQHRLRRQRPKQRKQPQRLRQPLVHRGRISFRLRVQAESQMLHGAHLIWSSRGSGKTPATVSASCAARNAWRPAGVPQ
jgi:hypothetical protein